MHFTPTQVINLLRVAPCLVSYTKVNGDKATMKCSLQESVLPKRNSSISRDAQSGDLVTVYNLDKNAWRSFRAGNVKSIEVL